VRAGPVYLLLLCLAVPAAAAPSADAEWYRLEAGGVLAYTDDVPDRAADLLSELVRFRLLLARALPGGPAEDGRPVVAYLFRDAGSFREYAPVARGESSAAAGFFMPRREGAFIAVRLGSASGARTVRHELVHQHLFRLLGGAPPWLDEGLAEYLSVARFDGGRAILGEPVASHVDLLRAEGWFPLERVLGPRRFEAAHQASGQAHRLYAQSWAIVHCLRTGGTEARSLLDRQLGELAERGPLATGLLELAGDQAAALERRLQAHLAREELPVERLVAPAAPRVRIDRRRLPLAERHAALGELLLAIGPERRESAREHFEAARRARRSLARAWRGLGLGHELEGRVREARPLFEEAARLDPGDPEVLLSLGRNLLGLGAPDFDADRVPPEDAARARRVLRRAVELDPERAESLAALGTAGLMVTTDADGETGAALEVAHELLPHRSDVAYHLLVWHLRRDELDEARRLLDEAVLPREEAGSELAVRALNVVTLGTLERAERLRRLGRTQEAVRLLERRLADGVHASMHRQVARALAALR
jgi:tetratricopeptide (TPR) repeat protein